MITKTTYIANDGIEFSNPIECLMHEGLQMWGSDGQGVIDMNSAVLVYFPDEETIQYFCSKTYTENIFIPNAYYFYSPDDEVWHEIDFIKDSKLIDRIAKINKEIRGY